MQQYTIQDVSLRLKLPKSTLRYWEKEFIGFISPQRTTGGQRRYTEQDVAALEQIHILKKRDLSLRQIRRYLKKSSIFSKNSCNGDIDQLAEYIASIVRREIHNFFYPET